MSSGLIRDGRGSPKENVSEQHSRASLLIQSEANAILVPDAGVSFGLQRLFLDAKRFTDRLQA